MAALVDWRQGEQAKIVIPAGTTMRVGQWWGVCESDTIINYNTPLFCNLNKLALTISFNEKKNNMQYEVDEVKYYPNENANDSFFALEVTKQNS